MLRHTFVLVILFVAATASSGAALRQAAAPRIIEVTAQRFEFWPSEIRVTEGETIELRVQSDDTIHGFRIVGRGVNLIVPKRGKGEAVIRLPSFPVGRYAIECSRMCGAGHSFMRASLVVSAPRDTQ